MCFNLGLGGIACILLLIEWMVPLLCFVSLGSHIGLLYV
jgi:hypothetical protein